MQKIDTVIFDLGGVILDIDYNLTRNAFEKLGVKNFDEMYSQSTADKLFQKLETGKISEENFYRELITCAAIQLSPNEIRQAWNAMLLNFREKSLQFLDTIKSKYKLFLLSNTNGIHLSAFNKIYNNAKREKPFEKFFDNAYYSFEIGLRKPDVECYDWVLKENNLIAAHTLFIDDSMQNTEAARLAGMKTILLKSGEFIEDLGL